MQGRQQPIIVTFLLVNPIVLWLLTGKLWVAIALWSISTFITILLCHKPSPIRIKVWWFNLLTIACISYTAEAVFRIVYTEKDVPNLYVSKGHYYFNKPNLDQTFENEEFYSHYRTNCQGLRIPQTAEHDKVISKCDWLFIGDSFTQGAQVEYEEMYSSLISRMRPDKSIINAGISGAGICDLYHYLKSEGMAYKPERVILQIGVFNDFTNVVERTTTFSDKLIEWSSIYRFLYSFFSESIDLPLGRWCEPFRSSQQGNIDDNILFKATSQKKEQDKQALVKYIDLINQLCLENGSELCIVLLPSKEQVSKHALEEVITAFKIDISELDMTYPNRWLSDILAGKSIQLIDLYEPFASSNNKLFFNIDEHLTADGHALIAKEINETLSTNIPNYKVISNGWNNERYPSLLPDKATILYQCFNKDGLYCINLSDSLFSFHNEYVRNKEELIHPTISKDSRYMAFTQGSQENNTTRVHLVDLILDRDITIAPSMAFSSIPMISNHSNLIAMPLWQGDSSASPQIAIIDCEQSDKVLDIIDSGESETWRPVFSNDDNYVLFIQKEKTFVVKRYKINTHDIETILDTGYDIWDIAISPSGRYMAYAGNEGKSWNLYLYDFEQKTIRQLTDTNVNEWDPSFGEDDFDLLFAVESGLFNGICRMRIAE